MVDTRRHGHHGGQLWLCLRQVHLVFFLLSKYDSRTAIESNRIYFRFQLEIQALWVHGTNSLKSSGTKIIKRLQCRKYREDKWILIITIIFCFAILKPCTNLSLNIQIWLIKRWLILVQISSSKKVWLSSSPTVYKILLNEILMGTIINSVYMYFHQSY